MHKNVTSRMAISQLDGSWSTRVLTLFENIPGDGSIFCFYLWHIWNRGNGFRKHRNAGKATREGIRTRLIESGLPDMNDPVFSLGYDPTDRAVKIALHRLIDSWKSSSPKKKNNLLRDLAAHYAD